MNFPVDSPFFPDDIVKKYDGKGMAVVGFEMDQVRRTPEGDVSVPITVAYNHHFESQMTGAKSRMVKVGADDPRAAAPTRRTCGACTTRRRSSACRRRATSY